MKKLFLVCNISDILNPLDCSLLALEGSYWLSCTIFNIPSSEGIAFHPSAGSSRLWGISFNDTLAGSVVFYASKGNSQNILPLQG